MRYKVAIICTDINSYTVIVFSFYLFISFGMFLAYRAGKEEPAGAG